MDVLENMNEDNEKAIPKMEARAKNGLYGGVVVGCCDRIMNMSCYDTENAPFN